VIVLLALVGIGENLVGLVDVFESLLGRRIARVDVGVVLASQTAIGLLDVFFRSALGNAQHLVVVFVFHRISGRPPAHMD